MKQKFAVVLVGYQVLVFAGLGHFCVQFFFVVIFGVRMGMSVHVAVVWEPELKSKVPKGFNKIGSDESGFLACWEVAVGKVIIMSREPGFGQSTTK